MLWLVPRQVPRPLTHFFLFNFLFSLSLLFTCGGKRGVEGGSRRRFEHRHSVYIYQNFFAFDRAIAIKMCSCSRPCLGCLPFFSFFPLGCVFLCRSVFVLRYTTVQFLNTNRTLTSLKTWKNVSASVSVCSAHWCTWFSNMLRHTHPERPMKCEPNHFNHLMKEIFFSFFLWALWKATRLRNSLITLESDKNLFENLCDYV